MGEYIVSVSQSRATKKNDLLLIDRDNVFARTLTYYMEMNLLNDKDMSELLGISISKVIDIKMGIVFGAINKDMIYKCDKIFDLPKGTFLKLLQKTLYYK